MNQETIETKTLALGHEAIHETVERILQNEPPGKVLDVPAGKGVLALRLKKHGFEFIDSKNKSAVIELIESYWFFTDKVKSINFID